MLHVQLDFLDGMQIVGLLSSGPHMAITAAAAWALYAATQGAGGLPQRRAAASAGARARGRLAGAVWPEDNIQNMPCLSPRAAASVIPISTQA